jgi:hypothetical protein
MTCPRWIMETDDLTEPTIINKIQNDLDNQMAFMNIYRISHEAI